MAPPPTCSRKLTLELPFRIQFGFICPVPTRYTWNYQVGEIASALQQYCTDEGLDPSTTYVWICCLCINQHRVKERALKGENVPFEEFRREFELRVRGIRRVLSLCTPWSAPENLTRIWW